jgi:flagellar biogenesis protein FliO
MVNVDSGKLKLALLIILLLVGFGLFMVRNIYTSQKAYNQEEAMNTSGHGYTLTNVQLEK